MDGVVIILAGVMFFSLPAYYIGKAVQRSEVEFECRHNGKVNTTPALDYPTWVKCEPPKRGERER